MITKTVKFKEWNCLLKFGQYENGRIAIELMNADPIKEDWGEMAPNTERIAVATVNVPDVDLKDNEIVVKDYSENDGMLAALIHGCVVHMPHKYVKTGFIECPVCILKILPEKL
jgi:hypothetical protein